MSVPEQGREKAGCSPSCWQLHSDHEASGTCRAQPILLVVRHLVKAPPPPAPCSAVARLPAAGPRSPAEPDSRSDSPAEPQHLPDSRAGCAWICPRTPGLSVTGGSGGLGKPGTLAGRLPACRRPLKPRRQALWGGCRALSLDLAEEEEVWGEHGLPPGEGLPWRRMGLLPRIAEGTCRLRGTAWVSQAGHLSPVFQLRKRTSHRSFWRSCRTRAWRTATP